MAETRTGLFFCEMAEDTPEFGLAADAGRVKRRIKALWEDGPSVAADFVGHAEVITEPEPDGRRWISRTTPHAFRNIPNVDGSNWLFCTAAPMGRGLGPRGNDLEDCQTHELAIIDLHYSGLTYDIMEDDEVVATDGYLEDLPDESPANGVNRYVTRLVKPSGKIDSLPMGMMKTVAVEESIGSHFIRQGLPFRKASAQVLYTWHDIPAEALPLNSIYRLMGTLNEEEFDGFPPQTLLFQEPDPQPRRSPLGQRIYTVQYRMLFVPNWNLGNLNDEYIGIPGAVARGHNWILRKLTDGTLDYVLVTSDGTVDGTPSFQTSNFSDLFQPDE